MNEMAKGQEICEHVAALTITGNNKDHAKQTHALGFLIKRQTSEAHIKFDYSARSG
jgi:hypothetical protein